VIARVAALGLPLAALLLAAPARAQEDPRAPAPAQAAPAQAPVIVQAPAPAAASLPPPAGCTVLVVGGPCVIVQLPPQPVAPPAYYAYPPAPYYAPAPPPGAEPLRPRTSTFSAKLFAGPSYQRLYDLAILGADFGVSLGAQRGISGWYAELEGLAGRTDHGLGAYQFWFGGSWEGKISRVHLGVGLHVGFLGVERATHSGGLMSGLGLGGFGFGSVDLYQTDDGQALYAGARITANWMDSGSNATAILWGPSATLGWRF
jgi:hypothetical protein